MDKISHLFVVFVLSILTGCASLWGIKSVAEADEYKLEKSGVTEVKKELLQVVSVAMANEVDSLENGINFQADNPKPSSQVNTLPIAQSSSPQEISPEQIDSLREKLLTDGSIKINPAQSYLIDYLKPKKNLDTLFLANLFFPTEKRGIPVAFQYQVKKDDQIFFEFENQKARKIKKIEIIEGGESRFYHTNLKKKKKIEGSLTIQSDNTLTINIVKSGFFKSVIRMKIRKLSKPQSYTVEMVNDTLIETKIVVEEVIDTLFAKVEEKKYTLSPRLNITHVSRMDFPIAINDVDNLIGWGYWLGLCQDDLEKYKTLAQSDPEMEPLVSFIKSELGIMDKHTYLPRSENPDVYLQMNKLVSDSPSLNSTKNYGFFTCGDDSSSQKAKIYLANRSKIYRHDISLMLVAVNLEHSQKEIEKEFYTEIPRLKLTLIH
jgi:hypothetical protein